MNGQSNPPWVLSVKMDYKAVFWENLKLASVLGPYYSALVRVRWALVGGNGHDIKMEDDGINEGKANGDGYRHKIAEGLWDIIERIFQYLFPLGLFPYAWSRNVRIGSDRIAFNHGIIFEYVYLWKWWALECLDMN